MLRTMPSKCSGSKPPKTPRVSTSGSEDLGHASAVPSSPDKSEVLALGLGLLGSAAILSPSAPVYITEEVFASALGGGGFGRKIDSTDRVFPLPLQGSYEQSSCLQGRWIYPQETRQSYTQMSLLLRSQH